MSAAQLDGGRRVARWAIALLLSVGALGISRADNATASHACELLSSAEAQAIADSLTEAADYQGAAECYDAAGDTPRAHLAYAKAVAPKSQTAGESLRQQGDCAKALLTQLERAFHSKH